MTTWPAGGGLTITATGTAPVIPTGSEPTLTFGASVASASGSPDPNPANDTPPLAYVTVHTPLVCNLALQPPAVALGPVAQSVDVKLAVGPGCSWTVKSAPSWLNISPLSGTGDARLIISPKESNPVGLLVDPLVINDKSFVISQAAKPVNPCNTLRLQRNGDAVTGGGINGETSFTVYAENQCSWSAQPSASWITLVSGVSGKGNAGVSYTVDRNDGTADRTGTILINGKAAFTINQAGGDSGDGGQGGGGDSGGDGGDGGGTGGDSD